jgi:hypothetical protein
LSGIELVRWGASAPHFVFGSLNMNLQKILRQIDN